MKTRNFTFYFAILISAYWLDSLGAQTQPIDHAKHHQKDSNASESMPGPLDSLEKALDKNSKASTRKLKPRGKPPMKQSMSSAMPAGGGSSGGGMSGMMGMMGQMMGQAQSAQSALPSSELPGFPGASHIYHIGSNGFFLDHADMAKLTVDQESKLDKIKETSTVAQNSLAQKIQQAEEDLWKLTASDRPDIKSIEAKVREIETQRGERRIAFIRAVGEAASVLTQDQRAVLLGITPSDSGKPEEKKSSPGDM